MKNNGLKEYVKDGYRIKVSEKAYKLFYEKQGFKPVESVAAADDTETSQDTAADAAEETAATTKKTSTRSKKAAVEEE